ncbi:MAG: hypothetical protein AAFX81_17560 [Pseudomonadota bacterium]
MRRLALAALLVVTACGGGPEPGPAERDVQNALRLARFDFESGRYRQAVAGYERARVAADALDDGAALAAAGSEGALARLRAGDAAGALRAAKALDAELLRRGQQPPQLSTLVEAAALLALDDPVGAERLAGPLTTSGDRAVVERAWYVVGRAAAIAGDAGGLDAAIRALDATASPLAMTDREDLTVRRDLARGNPRAALNRIEPLIASRRAEDSPTGVGEALALGGAAAEALGDAERAGDYYLRAARNALARERPDLAAGYLADAERQGAPALAEAAADVRARVAAAEG